MKKIVLFITLTIFGTVIVAQNNDNFNVKRPINSINLNLLGDASIISVNYERIFLIDPLFILTSKVGLGYNEEFQLCIFGPCSSPPEDYITIPHHITINLGTRKHFLEYGIGGTIICGNTTQNYLLYPIVGYRILPINSNKVNFRIYAQIPFTGLETEDILFIPFGLSLGISF